MCIWVISLQGIFTQQNPLKTVFSMVSAFKGTSESSWTDSYNTAKMHASDCPFLLSGIWIKMISIYYYYLYLNDQHHAFTILTIGFETGCFLYLSDLTFWAKDKKQGYKTNFWLFFCLMRFCVDLFCPLAQFYLRWWLV